ncbi:MAG: hydantoinase B/oxoprolinase family protein, partial [Gammaproteobacteria bacterium]|nr:hydantoinase B/oxoprolinase family protein [Gammaproteobacteria bacterium]
HIPVHLGSMTFAMAGIVSQLEWHEGDMVVVNDPYMGGTHLPDVTLIAPLFIEGQLTAFVVNRAHHANIGGSTPGSMPISGSLEEEGVVIPPSYLIEQGELNQTLIDSIFEQIDGEHHLDGDFSAQISANRTGVSRLANLITAMGQENYRNAVRALNEYAEKLTRTELATIPEGEYIFEDYLDDDGLGNHDLLLVVSITVEKSSALVDFSGTTKQTAGNVNCPLSVAVAGVYYLFRCLLPDYTPACAGAFKPISVTAPKGCLLNAERPAAVAAGNVETSTRVVDLVAGALSQAIPERIPAASHGSMNNLAMGHRATNADEKSWDYYETIGGGMGAGSTGGGLSGLQTHMTNTLNTPIEVLEMNYPVRITRYAIRDHSGGNGRRSGGDGLIREYQFLAPAEATLLTERRINPPWGLACGEDGQVGENRLNGELLGGKAHIHLNSGDRLTIATPGGGGFGFVES